MSDRGSNSGEPNAMLIYSVAVAPEHQGRGLGRKLLALAEDQARQAGYALIRLYTNEHMVENIGLYRRLGYEETRREHYLGSAVVHMARGWKPDSVAPANGSV